MTEPGSSGSPLFDQNHRIIGQLYGGAAACSGTVNNGQYDYYGRLGVAWNNGVDNYLAPNQCGTVTTNDGWDPNTPTLPDDAGISGINSPSGAYCVDNFDAEITLRNYGTNNITNVTINYNFDGGTNNIYNWTGNLAPNASETIIFPNMITTGGPHTFNAYTTLPNGNLDSNPVNDGSSSNYVATIGGQDVLIEINTDCWGSEVTWTVEDANANVLASGGPYTDIAGGEYIVENICLAVGCYDFIINDSYGDGMFGSQWGSCSVDGDYTITDVSSATVLASVLAINADYGNQEINNFCVPQATICGTNVVSTITNPQCSGMDNGSISVSVSGGAPGYTYNWGSSFANAPNIDSLSSGSYTLIISDSLLCDTIIYYNLDYTTTLSLTTNSYNVSCNGANDGSVSVTATGSSGYVYDWGSSFANVASLSGLSAGTYSVSVTDINGCMKNASTSITEPPADQVGYTYNSSDLRVYFSNTSSLGAYSWDFGDGATSSSNSPFHDYPSNGTYNACLTLTSTCNTISSCNDIVVFDSSSVNINELNQEDIQVFPNPSRGIFNVSLMNLNTKLLILETYDISGRKVSSSVISNRKEATVDLSECKSGTYILKLIQQEMTVQKRIIKL